MEEKLLKVEQRYHDLEQQMSKPEVISDQSVFKELTKEHSQLTPIIQKYNDYKKMKSELLDSQELVKEEQDSDMAEMMQSEIEELEQNIVKIEDELLILLLPKDENSGKDIMLEIRAGTGGDEAALFVADLFRMYQRYADVHGWKLEYISINQTEIGGYKEIIFSLRSPDAFDTMKYESGVHRVQRIPTTESGGRIHTSAVTVAVMAEAEEKDIDIDPNDLRVDVYRASGHGGQSVNTTDSAVRITHVPTGMIVTCQDEKSQLKNKTKALRVLRSRLLEKNKHEEMAKKSEMRKAQVGSGDRSERIRTYNFPQSRITDHRIGLTLYNLEAFLAGDMQDVIEALKKYEVEQLLKAGI